MAEPSGLFRSTDDHEDDERSEAPRPGLPIKRIAIVAASLAAAALAVSGVIYGPTVTRVLQQSDTELRSPDQAGGLTLDKSDDAKVAAEYIRDAIATAVNLEESVGLIYRDQANSVILVAGTARVWKPESSLDAAFAAVADDSGGVRDLSDVPSGDLGGVVRCGVTTTPDGDFAVCGWADNGSIGVALLPGRQPADAAKTMLDLRQAVEHRP